MFIFEDLLLFTGGHPDIFLDSSTVKSAVKILTKVSHYFCKEVIIE